MNEYQNIFTGIMPQGQHQQLKLRVGGVAQW